MNADILKFIHKELTPEHQTELERKLAESAEFKREYDELCAVDEKLKSIFDEVKNQGACAENFEQLKAQSLKSRQKFTRKISFWERNFGRIGGAFAIAALAMFAFVLWGNFSTYSTKNEIKLRKVEPVIVSYSSNSDSAENLRKVKLASRISDPEVVLTSKGSEFAPPVPNLPISMYVQNAIATAYFEVPAQDAYLNTYLNTEEHSCIQIPAIYKFDQAQESYAVVKTFEDELSPKYSFACLCVKPMFLVEREEDANKPSKSAKAKSKKPSSSEQKE